ncbi:hypothetical protein GT347_12630 [Xylophilus rhododendri]|uniref:Uncharacterized protein n=1 Tax=Xylophilus rhododendri TaxID=2697032 RepID=A0A857J485_9BURK|nr:hypothetical protein [Xylophilus rhododendri]QHI98760.1 hypothetical protein GT347_12630 [Xylophilus rhododendri]
MLSRVPPPSSPPRAPLPKVGTALIVAPQRRLEYLPNELLQELFLTGMEQNAVWGCLGIDATRVVAGLNARMAAALAQAAPASEAMRQLTTARDTPAFAAALALLPRVAPQYRQRCREAAWWAVVHRAPAPVQRSQEDWLHCLLDAEASSGKLHPPLWQRAVRLLARPEMDAPGSALVGRLLACAAAARTMAPADWRRLLRLVARSMEGRGPDASCFDAKGLNTPQQAELDTVLACCALSWQRCDRTTVRAMIARIEASVSPDSRCEVLVALSRSWPWNLSLDAVALEPLRDALLRVPDGDLERALEELPPIGDPASRQRMFLDQCARLPPDSALRVLDRQSYDFDRDTQGRDLLQAGSIALLNAALAQPAIRCQALQAFARLSARLKPGADTSGLSTLALRACGNLPAAERIAVLARLKPDAPNAQPWAAAWQAALAELADDETPGKPWRDVRALTSGLWSRCGRAAVLPRLEAALQGLTVQDRSRALAELAALWNRCPGGCTEAEFDGLLRWCEALPFYLRQPPLQVLRQTAATLPPYCAHELEALFTASDEAHAAWAAGLPPLS